MASSLPVWDDDESAIVWKAPDGNRFSIGGTQGGATLSITRTAPDGTKSGPGLIYDSVINVPSGGGGGGGGTGNVNTPMTQNLVGAGYSITGVASYTGTSATLSGTVSAANANISGTGTIGVLTAGSASVSGAVTANSLTTSGALVAGTSTLADTTVSSLTTAGNITQSNPAATATLQGTSVRNLTSQGAATINGASTCNAGLTVSGGNTSLTTLTVSGSTNIAGGLTVSAGGINAATGALTCSNLTMGGIFLQTGGTASFSGGGVSVGSTLNVTGTTTLGIGTANKLNIGEITQTIGTVRTAALGATTCTSLDVLEAAFDSLDCYGTCTVSGLGGLQVSGGSTSLLNTSVDGTLAVSGNTTLSSLAVSGGLTAGSLTTGSTLNVSGLSTLSGVIAGGVSCGALTVTGGVSTGALTPSALHLPVQYFSVPGTTVNTDSSWEGKLNVCSTLSAGSSLLSLASGSSVGRLLAVSLKLDVTGRVLRIFNVATPAGSNSHHVLSPGGSAVFRWTGSTWDCISSCDPGYVSVTTQTGAVSLTVDDLQRVHTFTSTAAIDVALPPISSPVHGTWVAIKRQGATGTITVKTATGTTVASLANQGDKVMCIQVAGGWSIV